MPFCRQHLIEHPEERTLKTFITNDFSKIAGYKINIQKSIAIFVQLAINDDFTLHPEIRLRKQLHLQGSKK